MKVLKKFLRVVVIGVLCGALSIIFANKQERISQIVCIISTAVFGAVISACYEYVDTHGQGLKLWFQTQIQYRNKGIRLSLSYLYRIKVRGKYLLIKGNCLKNQFQPVGGVYKYYREAKRFLDDIQCKGDMRMKNTDDDDDLRIKLQGKHVLQFFDWFLSMKDREYDPLREFREELIESGILPEKEFSVINYRKVYTYKTAVQFSTYMQCNEILYSDIFEIYLNEEQKKILIETMNETDDRICWVTEEEIQSLCAGGIERNLGTNAPWILGGEEHE